MKAENVKVILFYDKETEGPTPATLIMPDDTDLELEILADFFTNYLNPYEGKDAEKKLKKLLKWIRNDFSWHELDEYLIDSGSSLEIAEPECGGMMYGFEEVKT